MILPVFSLGTTPGAWYAQQLESDKGHAYVATSEFRTLSNYIWEKAKKEKELQTRADLGLFDRVVWHGFST